MRRHHLDRRGRRPARRTLDLRFRHSDRLSGADLPESSHIARGLR